MDANIRRRRLAFLAITAIAAAAFRMLGAAQPTPASAVLPTSESSLTSTIGDVREALCGREV